METKMLAIIFTTAAGMVAMWATHKGNERVTNNSMAYVMGTMCGYVALRLFGL